MAGASSKWLCAALFASTALTCALTRPFLAFRVGSFISHALLRRRGTAKTFRTSTPPYRSENKEPELVGVFARLPKHGAWSDTYPGPDHVLKPHQRCATGRGHVPKPVHPFVPF
eukprot:scaffold99468_cov33-Phaeocystis_antarctica.AAC.1